MLDRTWYKSCFFLGDGYMKRNKKGEYYFKSSLGFFHFNQNENMDVFIRNPNTGSLYYRQGRALKGWTMQPGFSKAYRRLVTGMLEGLTAGFFTYIKVKGRGYKFFVDDSNSVLTLKLGYSHLIKFRLPSTVRVQITKKDQLLYIVGTFYPDIKQVMYHLQRYKKPEIYTGKGIFFRKQKIKKRIGKQALY